MVNVDGRQTQRNVLQYMKQHDGVDPAGEPDGEALAAQIDEPRNRPTSATSSPLGRS